MIINEETGRGAEDGEENGYLFKNKVNKQVQRDLR